MTDPDHPIEEINTVLFVGAGTMGCYNALVAAIAGYRAVLHDASPEALETAHERMREMAGYLVLSGALDEAAVEPAIAGIETMADAVRAARDADLVSESVPERLELKREVHRLFDGLCPPRTILTTNTSSLLVSEIATAVERGDRFAAMHSHLASELFDLVPCPQTSSQTMEVLERYVRSLGGIPLLLRRERPGYLANSMIGAVMGAAWRLLLEGGASVQEIDRAWMAGHGAAAGPFGWMDYVGLNVPYEAWRGRLEDPEVGEFAARVVGFLEPFIEKGHLGIKSGQGFYTWPEAEFLEPGFTDAGDPREDLYRRMFGALAGVALVLVADGIAEIADVDRAWMIVQRAPAGPLGLVDRFGLDETLLLVKGLLAEQGVRSAELKRGCDLLEGSLARGLLGVSSGRGFYSYPDPEYAREGFLKGEFNRREG